jgi:hypothetical protein
MDEIDVTVYEAPSERTYGVPQEVGRHVATMVQQYGDGGFDPLPERDHKLVVRLLTFDRVNTDDVRYIHDRFQRPRADDVLVASGSGATITRTELFGGDVGRQWVGKIVDGLERDGRRARDAELSACGYEPQTYWYVGLASNAEPTLVRGLARIPRGSVDHREVETMIAGGQWRACGPEDLHGTQGVALDEELTAFVSSAFLDGNSAVLLHPATPICFLDDMPLLTDIEDAIQIAESIVAAGDIPDPNSDAGHVYAIVSPTDTTAVTSVIKILPGPFVFTRNGGLWQPDPTTLGSLMSVNPPALVELTGAMLKSVLAQTDSADAAAAANPSTVSMNPAATAPVGVVPTPGAASPAAAPMTAALGQVVRLRHAYETGMVLTQAIGRRDGVEVGARREMEIRRSAMVAAVELTRSLRSNVGYLENVVVPAVERERQDEFVAGVIASVGGSAEASVKGRLNGAEALRKYWTTGKGGLRIAWNTPSDWYRCHSFLSKYVGSEQAKRQCAIYHKLMTGVWPGSHLNVK